MRDHVKIFMLATNIATEAHEGQKRKYTVEDYIAHPVAVAYLVAGYMSDNGFGMEEVFKAMTVAVLHDTVEDTDMTMEDILEQFGEEIAMGVWYLTKCPDYVGNRATRKKICQDRLASAPEWVRIIKTFDMYHNSLSIAKYDPKFNKVFTVETDSLLSAMGTTEIFPKK